MSLINSVRKVYNLKINSNIALLCSSPLFISTNKVRNSGIDQQLNELAELYIKSDVTEHDWDTVWFDKEHYRKLLISKGVPVPDKLLLHYIKIGWRRGFDPHPLINIGYYKDQAERKKIDISIEPIYHYETIGHIENLSLCQYFDNDWYAKQSNSSKLNLSPFNHFLTIGSSLLMDPSPLFSMTYVNKNREQSFESTQLAIRAYSETYTTSEKIRTHSLFDDIYYMSQNIDVAASGMSPLAHYTAYGFDEGRRSIDLRENKADQESPVDLAQFSFIETASYFHRKDIMHYYNLLETLRRECLQPSSSSIQKPLAIVTCFNDEDCIESIIRSGMREGFCFYIIDNWSNDGTWEKIEALRQDSRYDGIIEKAERYPADGPTDHYDWSGMLKHKEEIALQFPGRWILHQDSDEITVSLFPNATAARTLEAIAALNYNCVNMRMLDFRPTDYTIPDGDVEAYFGFFEFSHKPAYGVQIKAWVQGDKRIDLASTGGHEAKFEERRIFPIRLPRKHYPIRSVAHGRKKIFLERKPRFKKERVDLGWHTHYDDTVNDNNFIWPVESLTRFIPNGHVSVWFDMLFHGED